MVPFYTVGGHCEKTEMFTNKLTKSAVVGTTGTVIVKATVKAAGTAETAVADLFGLDNAYTPPSSRTKSKLVNEVFDLATRKGFGSSCRRPLFLLGSR